MKTETERFWAKVDKTGDCWNWMGCKNLFGYGRFRVGKKVRTTHRMAWELTNGLIPNNLSVLHKCDNTSCINPAHLFLGTQGDNIRDAFSKKRMSNRGERNSNTGLVDSDIVEVRKRYSLGGITQKELAKLYGISWYQIYNIVHNISWDHVPAQQSSWGL